MKTTILGILTIIVAVGNAALSLLKSGTFDVAIAITAITSGIGLVKAGDAPTQ